MSKHVQAKPEQMLSRKAVAERWQTSVETIKRRERAGLIKPLRFNSRLIRYRLADVEALEAAAAGAKE
jgi:predicted site-specific integrase-resolvase